MAKRLPRDSTILLILMTVAAAMAIGQTTAKKAEAATGAVTGQVTCADTNAPARFAGVTLERVPEEQSASSEKEKQDTGTNVTATTDLDGRFELDKVAVGRYYVLGSMAGYLNPLARFDQEQLHAMSEETRKELSKIVPIVDVEAGQAAAVTLRMERASELSGTVLYDDGSPAVGLEVQLLRKDKDGNLAEVNSEQIDWMGINFPNAMTDDRGRYRVIGTPPGEYAVRASLPTGKISVGGLLSGGASISINSSDEEGGNLRVYSGDVFRRKSAKILKIAENDQVDGVDIKIPLAGLHIVRGTVTAKRDGHALNKGEVDLLYADDEDLVRQVHVAEDGSFQLNYVPEDKYILRVSAGADTEQVEIHPYPEMTVRQDKVIRSYGSAETPLLVQGDVSGVELAAPEAATEKVAQQ
jgi:hypothetical protein